MGVVRYYKTLFIPALNGQAELWRNEVSKIANHVDEIIQLGNIVGLNPLVADDVRGRGGNSILLNYVELWRSTFDNWVQLVGPNEILALNSPDEWTGRFSNAILRHRWLNDNSNHRRYKVATVSKNRLVTHGGLTHGLWAELGRPSDPHEAADMLNKRYTGTLFQSRCHALGYPPNFKADPIFADPLRETYPSWITADEPMPFGQVHGGEGLNTTDGHFMLNLEEGILPYMEQIRFYDFGSVATLRQGNSFLSVNARIPDDELIKKLVKPWRFYIEKTPVIDNRTVKP